MNRHLEQWLVPLLLEARYRFRDTREEISHEGTAPMTRYRFDPLDATGRVLVSASEQRPPEFEGPVLRVHRM